MKRLALVVIGITVYFISFSQNETKDEVSNVSEESILGQWNVDEKEEYFIGYPDSGGLSIVKTDGLNWMKISKTELNEFKFHNKDKKDYFIYKASINELRVKIKKKAKASIKEEQWTRVEVTYDPKDSILIPDSLRVKYFGLYYPSTTSPYGFYIGRMNRKWNLYVGLRFSNFFLYEAEGGPYESENENLIQTEGVPGTYRYMSTYAQSTFTIGLSNKIYKNLLHIHYGIGYGRYVTYKGFDLWEKDSNDELKYTQSVWANEINEEVLGIVLELGLIFELGPGFLLSTGVNTLNYDKFDWMFGFGYTF